MGDDTRAALNGAPCAVAIASRGYQCHRPHHLETLGVGYDGSPESSLALGAARELAAEYESTILALHVVSLEDVRGEVPLPAEWPEGTSRLIHQSSDQLDELGDDVLGDAVYGGPREELVGVRGEPRPAAYRLPRLRAPSAASSTAMCRTTWPAMRPARS